MGKILVPSLKKIIEPKIFNSQHK